MEEPLRTRDVVGAVAIVTGAFLFASVPSDLKNVKQNMNSSQYNTAIGQRVAGIILLVGGLGSLIHGAYK